MDELPVALDVTVLEVVGLVELEVDELLVGLDMVDEAVEIVEA